MSVAEITSPSTFSPGLWRSESVEATWVSALTSSTQVSADQILQITPATTESTLSIDLPKFGAKLTSEIVDLEAMNNYSEITFRSIIDIGVIASLTIRNEASAAPDKNLRVKNASLRFEASEHHARSLFITDTLYALLGLAGPVRVSVPDINLDMSLQFNVPLSELSELLQRRKMYFGLLVIEKATGKKFQVPEYISGEDISAILFSARAILDKRFIWRVNEIVQPTPSNDETLTWFQNLKPAVANASVFKMMFGPTPTNRLVLGQEISLGSQTVLLEDAVIEDGDRVASALASRSGYVVTIRIKPLSRVGTYIFTDSPTLPDNAWDKRIRHFIEMDQALSHGLINGYLQMMSVVVPELPPEQMYALLNPETIAQLAEQAREHRTPVDEYLLSLLKNIPQPASIRRSKQEFELDMAAFADGTENLPPYSGSYSRSDIYFDHD